MLLDANKEAIRLLRVGFPDRMHFLTQLGILPDIGQERPAILWPGCIATENAFFRAKQVRWSRDSAEVTSHPCPSPRYP